MSTTEGPDRGYEERERCAFFHWVFFKRFFFFFFPTLQKICSLVL